MQWIPSSRKWLDSQRKSNIQKNLRNPKLFQRRKRLRKKSLLHRSLTKSLWLQSQLPHQLQSRNKSHIQNLHLSRKLLQKKHQSKRCQINKAALATLKKPKSFQPGSVTRPRKKTRPKAPRSQSSLRSCPSILLWWILNHKAYPCTQKNSLLRTQKSQRRKKPRRCVPTRTRRRSNSRRIAG